MLLVDLFEARDPKKSYELVEVKGKLDKIIVKLTGTESAKYTKMAKRYTEINNELKKLQEERDKMNDDIKKDILENYFDAEDAVATRIIETISLTAQLAKTPTPSPKIDNDKVLDALLELMPDLKEKVKDLQKQFTTIPSPKAPALSVKVSEGAADVWADFKKKATALLKTITSWGKSYDKKLAKIREMMKPVRQVAEATIAHYDELHRQQAASGKLMKAKTIIKNLNDSTMSQDDVKAIIKAMTGVDGDTMLSAEDMKKFVAKAKVDLDDVLASASLTEAKAPVEPFEGALGIKSTPDGKTSAPNMSWRPTENPFIVKATERTPEDKANAKAYLKKLDQDVVGFKKYMEDKMDPYRKDKEKMLVNMDRMLTICNEYNEAVEAFNKIAKAMNAAATKGDLDTFDKELQNLKSLFYKQRENSRISKTKQTLPHFMGPARTLVAQGYDYMMYSRDKAETWLKRERMSPSRRAAAEKASANMKMRWME